MQVVKFKD